MFTLFHRYRFERKISHAYDELSTLQTLYFDNYLKHDDVLKQFKSIQKPHRKFYKILKKLRRMKLTHGYPKKSIDRIQKAHEIMCAIHLLRFRVNDHSLWDICSEEMLSLQKSTANLFKECAKKNMQLSQVLQAFKASIEAFETLDANTLQVVARDPTVFRYFIQDLYALHKWGRDHDIIEK